jgi:hypothetical protein
MFVAAGAIAEVPGSPIPPGGSELWTIWSAQHLVSIEVDLHDTAVLQRYSDPTVMLDFFASRLWTQSAIFILRTIVAFG